MTPAPAPPGFLSPAVRALLAGSGHGAGGRLTLRDLRGLLDAAPAGATTDALTTDPVVDDECLWADVTVPGPGPVSGLDGAVLSGAVQVVHENGPHAVQPAVPADGDAAVGIGAPREEVCVVTGDGGPGVAVRWRRTVCVRTRGSARATAPDLLDAVLSRLAAGGR